MAMEKGLGSGKSDECGVQVMQGLNYQFGSLDLRGFPKHVGILIMDNLFFLVCQIPGTSGHLLCARGCIAVILTQG